MARRSVSKRAPHRRPRWRPRIETLESRRVLSGIPLGGLPDDTAEFLLGRVAVTPVFFDSNGEGDPVTQNWTDFEIEGVLQKIHEGMDWWVDTLAALETVHSLEFVYDHSYALEPVETVYEPIDRPSNAYSSYVGNWLTEIGYGDSGTIEKAIRSFNHQQRLAMDADWAFTVVVVDSSDDADGQFASGGSFSQAFAFPGGMFMVAPSTRPASTFAHEMGHIFWARDEYTGGGSWTDQRGYYNAQNLNAADNPTPGFQQQPSIMSSGTVLTEAYANHVTPASTLAFVGWQDSDGNGIFDVLDVPLHLEGSGRYDADSGLYTFDGAAWAVALENRNSSGLQNDITLNRISRIEYSVDGGAFWTAIAPDSQRADVSFSIPVAADFQSISVRAIDAQTGITSQSIDATPTRPGYVAAAAAGFAFVDANDNGIREANERMLTGLNARITVAAGRDSLPGGHVDPAEFSPGPLPDSLDGVDLWVDGPPSFADRVGVATDGSSPRPLLASFDERLARWDIGWSSLNTLVADFDEPTSDVRIEVVGVEADSIARMEAYDAEGNYLFRSNTTPLQEGETASLRLEDAEGRIARVRVFGHARTEVALGRLEFGPHWNTTSDRHGVIRFENLPDGTYDVQLEPALVIHQPAGEQFNDGTVQITVSGGASSDLTVPVRRIDSPWTNPELAEDVDQNGRVEPLDALKIINDLNRHGSRNLPRTEPNGSFFDANNDGKVTPADALSVINALNRQQRAAEGESSPSQTDLATSDDSPTTLASAALSTGTVSSGPMKREPTASAAGLDATLDEQAGPQASDDSSRLAAEGESDRRFVNGSDDAESSISPAPPAIWVIDRVFRDFAEKSSGEDDDRLANRGAISDDRPMGAGDLRGQNNPLHLFSQEPFESKRI